MSEFLDNLAGDFDSLGKIAGGITGIGTAVSGVADLLGFGGPSQEELQAQALKMQYEYQTKLNEQQQEYARENADTEYQRQRQMTRDQYSLNKQGMLDAGLSPAGDGFQVRNATSPSIAAPSAGSVGMPSFDAGLQYKKMDSLMKVLLLIMRLNRDNFLIICVSFVRKQIVLNSVLLLIGLRLLYKKIMVLKMPVSILYLSKLPLSLLVKMLLLSCNNLNRLCSC